MSRESRRYEVNSQIYVRTFGTYVAILFVLYPLPDGGVKSKFTVDMSII